MKFFKVIFFWLKVARLHTLPTSFLSCLVPLLWSLKHGGNLLYGLLAMLGVMSAHLGVNLIDDYFDYKREVGTIKETLNKQSNKMQKGKCKYLKDGKATLNGVLIAICVYFGLASILGSILLYLCGPTVFYIAIIAAFFCVSYPFLTYCGLSEIAVGLTFAPLLYAGIAFVMLGLIPVKLILLSVSTGLLTVGLLHTHALMDFDCDIPDRKKTLCTLLGNKFFALNALALMMFLAYFNILAGIYYNFYPKIYVITFLSLPLAIGLYLLLWKGIISPQEVPVRKFWMGPMANWSEIVENNAQSFMLKFLLSRNLMMFFTILLCIAIVFS